MNAIVRTSPPLRRAVLALAALLTAVVPSCRAADGEPGVGVVVPRFEVELCAERSGRLVSVDAELGERVPAGERVAVVARGALEQELSVARAQLRSARAALDKAKLARHHKDGSLTRRLAASESWSKEELAASRLEAQLAAASVEESIALVAQREAAIARLVYEIARSDVVAPFAGRVAERLRDPGGFVGVGEPILRLLSEELIVRCGVPSERAARLTAGDPVSLVAGSDSRTGRVLHVGVEIDPASRLVALEIALPAPRDGDAVWTPGMPVSVTLLPPRAP